MIETSAPKVQKDSVNVALVDKFELELDSLKVKKIERQLEPETFNKNSFTPTKTVVDNTKSSIVLNKTTSLPNKVITNTSPPLMPVTAPHATRNGTKKSILQEDAPGMYLLNDIEMMSKHVYATREE